MLSRIINRLVRPVYNSVLRPHVPRKLAVCNGIVARRVRLFDNTDYMPDYEQTLLGAIRNHIKDGDRVVEIGGGFGVSTVVAANCVGTHGTVRSFEGSEQHVNLIREAGVLNGVSDRITVIPEIVGPAYDVWGDVVIKTRDPANLPHADVLILDCEGAEQDILADIDIAPRIVIVEAHTHMGVSADDIALHLRERGYEVSEAGETAVDVAGVVLVGCWVE
jgi:precorrin-6B methylase 2